MIKRNSEYIDDKIGILLDLVHFKNNIDTLKNMLSQIGFDSEIELVSMSRDDIAEILQRSLDKKISFLELEEWANLIECREDIGFEDEKTQEMIFKLANPYLYGKLDEKQVLSYLNELDEKCGDKYKIVNDNILTTPQTEQYDKITNGGVNTDNSFNEPYLGGIEGKEQNFKDNVIYADNDNKLLGNFEFTDKKHANKAIERGWNEKSIENAKQNPIKVGESINRNTGNKSTVYFVDDNQYIVIDNVTNTIV